MVKENNTEITLQDLALKVKGWWGAMLSRWLLFVIVGITCGLLYGAYIYFKKPDYTGNLTFVLSSNSKGGSLANLAGQFGFDLGLSNDDVFSGDNIIELFKSKKIIKGALFRLLPDSSETLINLIADKSEMEKGWLKNKDLPKNIVPFPADVAKLTPVQDSLVSEIHDFILKEYLIVDKPDTKLSFYRVSTTSTDERISCYLTKYIVDEASQFYIQTKTKTAKDNLSMLQHEADSLRNLLSGAIVTTAAEADRTFNLNPAYQVQRSGAQQGQFRATVLGTAYGEVVKNLEIAKITLQREMPLYQIIDSPTLPLKKEKPGLLFSLIIGGLVAGFLLLFVLTIIYIFKVSYTPETETD